MIVFRGAVLFLIACAVVLDARADEPNDTSAAVVADPCCAVFPTQDPSSSPTPSAQDDEDRPAFITPPGMIFKRTQDFYVELLEQLGHRVPEARPRELRNDFQPVQAAYNRLAEVKRESIARDTSADAADIQKRFHQFLMEWWTEAERFNERLRQLPITVEVSLDGDAPEFTREPELPAMVAGLSSQLMLVALNRSAGAPGIATHIVHADLSEGRAVRVPMDAKRSSLVLVKVSGIRHGRNKCELTLTTRSGDEVGRLPFTVRGARSARLSVEILDENGEPTPARVGMYTASGPQHPADTLPLFEFEREVFVRRLSDPTWPAQSGVVFFSRGAFEMAVPPGPCRVVVDRGLEYERYVERLSLKGGQDEHVEIRLRRFADLRDQDWYSADAHIHVERRPERNDALLEWTRAENVHVLHVLQMGIFAHTTYDQYGFGEAGTVQDGERILVPGEEDPRSSFLGHALMLGASGEVRHPPTYYVYGDAFDRCRELGGLSGYAHFGRQYHAERGLAAHVPLGRIDFLEVLHGRTLDTEVWYRFLDLGFALTPIGGSDFPFGNTSTASAAFFVQVDGTLTGPAWHDGLRAGRTFVSCGPLLEFSVNGSGPGSTVALDGPASLRIEARARASVTRDALSRLEIVQAGEVIREVKAPHDDTESLELSVSVDVEHGAWFALRAHGVASVAHSAPVYVRVNGDRTWTRSKVPALLDHMRGRLDETETLLNGELDSEVLGKDTDLDVLRENTPRILESIERARGVYDRMQAELER